MRENPQISAVDDDARMRFLELAGFALGEAQNGETVLEMFRD